jgi:hypothetical protein
MTHILANAKVGDRLRQRDGKIVELRYIYQCSDGATTFIFKGENGYSTRTINYPFEVVEIIS